MDNFLPDKRYATVVIDPPWSMPPTGVAQMNIHYKTMSLEEIAALPIADVLAEDAWLFCWTINRFVAESIEIVRGWGLEYKFLMTWVKNHGIKLPGTPMFNAEWCIVAKYGNPTFVDTRYFFTANTWKRRQHSEKPEEFYDLLRRCTSEPRLDIFSRRRIAGFDTCGDQSVAGESLETHYQMVM